MKFLEPTRKPKVIYTDNSLEFGKACEDLSWNYCTSTPHRSENEWIAERAARRVKEGTSAVLLQSGLDREWWADSMECYAYLRNIQDPLSDGKTPYEEPFKGPIIPFGSLVEYYPTSAKDISRLHQFGPEVLPGIFFGYVLYAGWIWKGDIMIADVEELEEMDASELHVRRLNAKEVLTPQRSGNFIFPVADGTVKKSLGENSVWEHPPRPGSVRNEEKNKKRTRKVRRMTFSNPTSRRLNARWRGSWNWLLDHYKRIHLSSSRWTQSQTVRAERRIISYSVEVHRRHQGYKCTIGCDAGEKFRRLLERWWRKRIVRFVDRLHKIHCVERKATWWIYMVRWETYEETNNLKTRQRVAGYVEAYVWCSGKESKTKMGHRETKARQCQTIKRNIFYWNDEEFKLTKKAARKKLEVPMPAAMLCTIPIKSSGENHLNVGKRKTKYACIVDGDESTRPRLEGAGHKPHQDHITAKGMNSISHYSLVHKVIPMPQALKHSRCKGSSGDRMVKMKKILAADKSQKQKRSDRRSKEHGQKSSFCVIDGSLSSQEFGVGASISKVQRQSRTPMWHCERCFRIIHSVYRTRIISNLNDSRKSHGHCIKASRMFRTSSWCSIRLYSGQSGRCINVIRIPKSEGPDIWIRLPKHSWPKSWSSVEDPVVLLERNLYGHLLAGLPWERQF